MFSSHQALKLYEPRIENQMIFETLPKIRRVWLAVYENGGISLVSTNNHPLLKLPNHHGGIIIPGCEIQEGQDHIQAIIDLMKKDFGTEITPLVSKLGNSLIGKGKGKNSEQCLFIDDTYITIGRINKDIVNCKQYVWHNQVHVGSLAQYATDVFNPTNGELGVMPVILMLVFAAIPLLQNNTNFVEKYEVKTINNECFLTNGKQQSNRLLNPTMYGNKFLGFESHSFLINQVNQRSNPVTKRF
ncbi:MAG: hypothetical protein LBE20_02955 [Deltaproteobacteria bacterium]|nr:hypothetical protein [Deltaproteobacteria bacterium]